MDGGAWWATIHGALIESDTTEHVHTHTHTFLEKHSSTSCISLIFMLASGHPGLKIKIPYYCMLYTSVQ